MKEKPQFTATVVSTLSTATLDSLLPTVTFAKSVVTPKTPSTSTTEITPIPTIATPSISEPVVEQLLTLVNALWLENGCKALVLDERLTEAAFLHSQDMATQGYFDHNSLDGCTTYV